jgi:hypothetical protein
LDNWKVQIVVMISKLILLDQLYLHKMITDGKRRKDQNNFHPIPFCLAPKNSIGLQKSGLRWIFEPIISGSGENGIYGGSIWRKTTLFSALTSLYFLNFLGHHHKNDLPHLLSDKKCAVQGHLTFFDESGHFFDNSSCLLA